MTMYNKGRESGIFNINPDQYIPQISYFSKEDAEAFVEQVRTNGFEYVRFELPDMAGLSRGKTIPIGHIASYMRTGLNLYGGAVALDSYSIPVKNSGYNEEVNFTDCVMIPDIKTLSKVPWLNKTARVICDTMWYDGKAQMAAPRLLLKKILNFAESLGYVVKMGHEYEFYITGKDSQEPLYNGQPIFVTSRTHKDEIVDQLIRVLQDQGIDIITWNSEHGPGQMEINYSAMDGIAAADRAFVFKGTVKEYLAKNGYNATFMTKPYAGLSGSCSHFHVSLLSKETGKNVFLDASHDDGMSLIMKNFIQGILNHVPASMALWNPTPNCYRRIRPQTYAPSNISWGIQDRSASVRVKASCDEAEHIEVRVPSAMSNPYLVAASTIASGLIGVIDKLQLVDPSEGPCENNSRFEKLPTEIPDSLKALENDSALGFILGEEFTKVYLAMKWQEFTRLRNHIPQAETNEYFELY